MKTSNKVDGRPAFQWYPDDWLSEPGLRLCDLSARGLWIDLLCHMFRMPERGMLRLNGRALTKQDLSNLVGRPEAEVEAALKQLESNGVAETDCDGTIYNRRMVRDENERRTKSEAGAKGGRESGRSRRERKGGSSTPSSSSSPASSSSSTPEKEKDIAPPTAAPSPIPEKKRKPREPFKAPTVEEVRAFSDEKGLNLDAQRFVNFYGSKGWVVGRSPMKDWRLACHNAKEWCKKKADSSDSGWDKLRYHPEVNNDAV